MKLKHPATTSTQRQISKKCCKCKRNVDISFFYKDRSKKDGLQTICKLCQNAYRKRNWKPCPPEKKRAENLKRRYGIDVETFQLMLEEQDYTCQICPTKHTEDLPLCVDHCHTTGKIRGLLCNRCNLVIGHAKDNISTLENAITYLQLHEWFDQTTDF